MSSCYDFGCLRGQGFGDERSCLLMSGFGEVRGFNPKDSCYVAIYMFRVRYCYVQELEGGDFFFLAWY